jgi:hypothetical protein
MLSGSIVRISFKSVNCLTLLPAPVLDSDDKGVGRSSLRDGIETVLRQS